MYSGDWVREFFHCNWEQRGPLSFTRHLCLSGAECGSEVVREFRHTMHRFKIDQELHNEILCCWYVGFLFFSSKKKIEKGGEGTKDWETNSEQRRLFSVIRPSAVPEKHNVREDGSEDSGERDYEACWGGGRSGESGRGKVENEDVTRQEGSSLITASQQPVWSWGMAEGCKAFEADNPFVMLTRVLERARWSSCSYCITGGIRELPFRPGAVTGAAVSVVGSGANLLQYLSAPRLALWSSPTVTRFPSRRVTACWAESCGGSVGRNGENTQRRASRGEYNMFIWGLSGNRRVWLFLCVTHHSFLILPLRLLHLNDHLVQRSELRVHSPCCVETGSHVFSSKISGFCWPRALTWLADWAVICLLRHPLTSDGLYWSPFLLSSQVVREGVDHTTCFSSSDTEATSPIV